MSAPAGLPIAIPVACALCAIPYNLHEAEMHIIRKTLEVTDGNRSAAAKILGINVRTLRRKLNRARPS